MAGDRSKERTTCLCQFRLLASRRRDGLPRTLRSRAHLGSAQYGTQLGSSLCALQRSGECWLRPLVPLHLHRV